MQWDALNGTRTNLSFWWHLGYPLTLLLFVCLSPCQIVIFFLSFFFRICVAVVVVVDVVCGCDVKLLLGRITFDLFGPRWHFQPCGNLLSCPAHSSRQHALVSSSCFIDCRHILSHFLFTTVILPWSPCPFPSPFFCAVQLYCGPTQAFTQYIKLTKPLKCAS